MKKHRILWVTDRSSRHQQRALDGAPSVFDVEMLANPSPEAIKEALQDVEILVSERRGHIDRAMLENASALRFILRLGATTHDIDLTAALQKSIIVSRQPDLGNLQVAEYCQLMMLALLKRLPIAEDRALQKASENLDERTDENTFAYNWAEVTKVTGIIGKTIAIVGMGDIGIELARRLKSFLPAKVLYNKRTPLPVILEQELGINYASFEACFSYSDVTVCLLPYNSQTDHLINNEVLSTMREGAMLVQAGSGSTLDEVALAHHLQSGHLGGASLDTFENEPLQKDNPLWAMARRGTYNLILTPHIAGGTSLADFPQGYQYAEVLRFVRGEPLQLQINSL